MNRNKHDAWAREIIHYDKFSGFGVYEFQARSGRHFFKFDIQPDGGAVRIYIREQPDYGPRASDLRTTRRLRESDGRLRVDVQPASDPRNLQQALAHAVKWADATSAYITYGRPVQ